MYTSAWNTTFSDHRILFYFSRRAKELVFQGNVKKHNRLSRPSRIFQYTQCFSFILYHNQYTIVYAFSSVTPTISLFFSKNETSPFATTKRIPTGATVKSRQFCHLSKASFRQGSHNFHLYFIVKNYVQNYNSLHVPVNFNNLSVLTFFLFVFKFKLHKIHVLTNEKYL